jgi:sugar transferase EpsL
VIKAIFDRSAAFFGLLVLSPLFLVLSIMIRMKLGSPIFFIQPRGGYHGRVFNMVKFRTMTDERDQEGKLLPDSLRMTPFGQFLRRSSLDELPGLWNVFVGDISLVGPRPLLVDYLPLYNSHQARRHDVKPGITGWAQINGRNAISWEEKFDYDVWYVDHQSFWLDLKILLLTIKKVVIKEGINQAGQVTISPFTGSHKNV